jgi:integrase
MGHASKQMIYEVYGRFVEGLDEDREAIIDYFGEDFITGAPKSVGHKSDCRNWLTELEEES